MSIVPSTLDIVGVDSLREASVTLSPRPDGASEILQVDVAGLGLVSLYNPNSGVLLLTGEAPASAYINAIRTLTYIDTLVSPTIGARRYYHAYGSSSRFVLVLFFVFLWMTKLF